jgi:hypothetical protein
VVQVRAARICVLLLLSLLAVVPAASASHWVPPKQLSWYWQLSGTVSNSYPAAVYDIDGVDNSASEVAALHAARKHVICYIDVGTWENWRSDAGRFPASVKGSGVQGWPGEQWLDVRQLSILEPIMKARFQMCAQKGFDAVEPDNIDGYENGTGFSITAQDQATYDEWVASTVHSLGMAVFEKNDPEQASTLEPNFDGVLDEQCNEYQECSSFQSYLRAGKPVLNAEYNLSTSQFCNSDNNVGIMGALYSISLDGSQYQPCWSGSPGFGGGSSPATGGHKGGADPNVGIAPGPLSDRGGKVFVRLSCPRGQAYCDGTVELDAAVGRHHTVVLGKSHFHIVGGHSRVIVIKLSTVALRKLGKSASARVAVYVSARDRVGRRGYTHRTTTLRLRR